MQLEILGKPDIAYCMITSSCHHLSSMVLDNSIIHTDIMKHFVSATTSSQTRIEAAKLNTSNKHMPRLVDRDKQREKAEGNMALYNI